jgi:hypothetical protein
MEEEETGCVASGLRLNNFLNAVHRLEEEERHENIRYFFFLYKVNNSSWFKKKHISVNKRRKTI